MKIGYFRRYKMAVEQLLSELPNVMAQGLKTAISEDLNSSVKGKAREGVRYYHHENDILKNRIFYINDDGKLQEDTFASNIRIPHGFFPEQVDQKTQYLLSNPIEATVEDEQFQERLDEYYDDSFQVTLQELVEGASQKGFEYLYARTTAEDKLTFQVADGLHVFPVYNDNLELKKICRYYKKKLQVKGKATCYYFAELWDDKQVYFFKGEEGKELSFDGDRDLNPRPHILAVDEEGNKGYRTYGEIPFYRFSNNKKEHTDLEPIKALIDDYDLMNAFLSNNLQDFAEAIYVVSGFQGDNLSKLRQNIKSKKVVGTARDGGVDIKTVTIPTEGRKTKMDIDKENIYKFGMAFDSTQIGDGNITNIVIKSRYTLLNMKANKTEARLRKCLQWVNKLIVDDINRRFNTAYNYRDIEINITREVIANESDVIANQKAEAETRQIIIETILAVAPRLDDESTLKLICEQFDLSLEDVQRALEEQDYTTGLTANTDPEEEVKAVGNGTEQVAERTPTD